MEIDKKIRSQYTEVVFHTALSIFHKNHTNSLEADMTLEELKAFYHKVKGGAGMLGLNSIHEVASKGEKNPETNDYKKEIIDLFEQLGQQI